MKTLIKTIITAIISIAFFSSCSIGQHNYNTVKTSNFSPDIVRLDLSWSDLELVGEVKVDVEYRTYLGAFKVYDAVNGEDYSKRFSRHVGFSGKSNMRLSLPIRKATYKVIDTYPGADYYVPVFRDKKVEKMFLGSKVKEEVTFKVYKYKK